MGKRTKHVMNDLNDFLEKTMKGVGNSLNTNLKEDTPKLTGWSENSWIAKAGSAYKGTAGSREDAEAGNIDFGPRQQGLAQIIGYKLAKGTLHITNNVYYINVLNTGTSKQAPALFVELAIDRSIREAIV